MFEIESVFVKVYPRLFYLLCNNTPLLQLLSEMIQNVLKCQFLLNSEVVLQLGTDA
jgi:hypothetical protein